MTRTNREVYQVLRHLLFGLLVVFVCLGVLCCFLGLFGFGFSVGAFL